MDGRSPESGRRRRDIVSEPRDARRHPPRLRETRSPQVGLAERNPTAPAQPARVAFDVELRLVDPTYNSASAAPGPLRPRARSTRSTSLSETPDFNAISLTALRRRRGTKWTRYPPDVLPAWVADMDFDMAEPIRAGLAGMMKANDLGYAPKLPASGLPEAFAAFAARRFPGWEVVPERMVAIADIVQGIPPRDRGVHPGRGDGICTLTPVYPPFLQAVAETGRRLDHCTMVRGEGRYEIDFDALRAAIDERTRLLLLCTPHNPLGRVFDREELEALAELASERDLVVVAGRDPRRHRLPRPSARPLRVPRPRGRGAHRNDDERDQVIQHRGSSLLRGGDLRLGPARGTVQRLGRSGSGGAVSSLRDGGDPHRVGRVRRMARGAPRAPRGQPRLPPRLRRGAASRDPDGAPRRDLPRLARLPGSSGSSPTPTSGSSTGRGSDSTTVGTSATAGKDTSASTSPPRGPSSPRCSNEWRRRSSEALRHGGFRWRRDLHHRYQRTT